VTLSARQREVLAYLDRCNHSTANIMRSVFGNVPTNTLRTLERLGYVKEAPVRLYGGFPSKNVRWEITERGRRAL